MGLPIGRLCRITTNIPMRLPRGGAALRPTGGLLEAAMTVLSLFTSAAPLRQDCDTLEIRPAYQRLAAGSGV
jgi:hypothetical protein